MIKQSISIGILIIFIALITGCSSRYIKIAPTPPEKYEKLGQVTGKASGSLVSPGISPGYNFIPIRLTSRFQRAYDSALAKAPGATSLINVTIDEYWFWWILGTNQTVTISGEAIKEVK